MKYTVKVTTTIMGLLAGTLAYTTNPVSGNPPKEEGAARTDSRGPIGAEATARSGGSYQLQQSGAGLVIGPYAGKEDDHLPVDRGGIVGTVFDGFDFDDNSSETGGWLFIPPDPMGAAGMDRLIAVVNVMIEARTKTGGLLWRDALRDFFAPLAPANYLFDPKVVYDHYEGRFVVVALEKVETGLNPDAGNKSRILLGVSKTAAPATATAADWYYHAINAKESIGGWDHWADYPGFEVDEEAVYITANMFEHDGGVRNFRVRLWILEKGVAGGFYGGGAASVTKYDPFALAGWSGAEVTTMPALVYGAGGVGPGIGTYLVGYSGWTWGGPGGSEGVLVIRVNNPLGGATFTATSFQTGDIENVGGSYGWPDLPDAPQSGTGTAIEVNDRRALDAVWRNNRLWFTTTINPNHGPDVGQTTAHWFRLDTSTWPPTLDDQGDIGGEDIHNAGNVMTFFPSLAVNGAGDAKFGFAASSAAIYPGAYVAGRQAGDPPGTVRPTQTVRAGLDYYVRTFGGSRNRWGDYSGISLDPTDDNLFWVYNEYAMVRGTPREVSPGVLEDGRWGTTWATCEAVDVPAAPVGTGEEAKTNRYLRFSASAPSVAGVSWEVIRVRIVALDGYPIPTPDLRYVGPPIQAPDEDTSKEGPTFTTAPLQCEPYAHDWTAEGIVSVYGAELMPGSTYEVQRAFAACPDLANEDACWSDPLTITTAKYGDIAPLYDNPANPQQPDFNDIAAMVRKFMASPGAPIKAVAQLQPNCVFPGRPIDFKDIAANVVAFVGTPTYAQSNYGPCTCPSDVLCGDALCEHDADCSGGFCIDGFCTDPCGRCTEP